MFEAIKKLLDERLPEGRYTNGQKACLAFRIFNCVDIHDD